MNGSDEVLSTVWAVGQRLPRVQRDDWYSHSAGAHPAKTWPQTARHAVAAFSKPGQVVVDPMCGIGTVVIEAARLGRHAYGVDCEPDWVAATATSLHLARQRRPGLELHVQRGDARRLEYCLPDTLSGKVDLVVTGPPYGKATRGPTSNLRESGRGIRKRHREYSTGRPQRSQLARSSLPRLLEGLREVFAGCHQLLKPAGHLVIASHPFTDQGTLFDFPAALSDLCEDIGFRAKQRCVALLAEWNTDQGIRPNRGPFELHNAKVALVQGRLGLLRVHEDVLVLVKDGPR